MLPRPLKRLCYLWPRCVVVKTTQREFYSSKNFQVKDASLSRRLMTEKNYEIIAKTEQNRYVISPKT